MSTLKLSNALTPAPLRWKMNCQLAVLVSCKISHPIGSRRPANLAPLPFWRHRDHLPTRCELGQSTVGHQQRGQAVEECDAQTNTRRKARILITTGDVSGDLHGAGLAKAIAAQADDLGIEVQLYGVGGSRMQAAGVQLIANNSELSSIGLLEAVPLIAPSVKQQFHLRGYLTKHPPDLVVLIDYPGVNISFGRYIKRTFGVPIVYYIPPNEWLWNESRTPAICEMSNLIFAVYPAEAEYFRGKGANVELVRHPLVDALEGTPTQAEARAMLKASEGSRVVALMPASRKQELRHVWPVIANAAKRLQAKAGKEDKLHFIVPLAAASHRPALEQGAEAAGIHCHFWEGESKVVMAAADLAITKSGSVNLELALLNVPQVAVYRLDPLTAWIARTVFNFNVPYISLVNLVMEEEVIPEFVQEAATSESIATAAASLLLDSQRRADVIQKYARLRSMLEGTSAPKRAAHVLLRHLSSR